jgi:hypothetical protein
MIDPLLDNDEELKKVLEELENKVDEIKYG